MDPIMIVAFVVAALLMVLAFEPDKRDAARSTGQPLLNRRSPAYNGCMAKRDAAQVLKDALALPVEARAAMAVSLLDSLDTAVDEDVEAAWQDEVHRRIADLDAGAVKTLSWADVRRRLAAR